MFKKYLLEQLISIYVLYCHNVLGIMALHDNTVAIYCDLIFHGLDSVDLIFILSARMWYEQKVVAESYLGFWHNMCM